MRAVIVLSTAVVFISFVSAASAEPGHVEITPSLGGGATEIHGDASGGPRPGADAVPAAASPPITFARIPACRGNDIELGVDVPCAEAALACGEPGQYQFWLYSSPAVNGTASTIGQPGWTFVGVICSAAADAADATLPGISLADFRRLPLPAGASTVEPPGGYVLVSMATNVFASSTEPVVLATTVLGQPVQVRATPARWSWDFGDGAVVGPTADPGAAYPALTNTHAYAERGDFDIVMTTYYTGEFSLDGTTWYPIQGEAQVDSAPVTVMALAGRNVLVADPKP